MFQSFGAARWVPERVEWDDMDDVIDHQTGHGTMRPSHPVVTRTVTDEAKGYSSAVAGIDIEAVRAGVGVGPTQILAATDDRLTFNAGKSGFPNFSRATVGDGNIVIAYVRSTPPGCRWSEIDLQPGAVVAYGPEAQHTSRTCAGIDWMCAITRKDRLAEFADQLGAHFEPPPRGAAHLLARSPKTELIATAFERFADDAASGAYPSKSVADGILYAMTHALSEKDRGQRVGRMRWIDSRHVVHVCIDYVDSVQRVPSISELCLVAHVSERRLRKAFTDEYDVPPARFFRAWALEEAHRRLVHNDAHAETVTEVAVGLGFDHLGRFSGQYKEIYGVSPSNTLRACQRDRSVV